MLPPNNLAISPGVRDLGLADIAQALARKHLDGGAPRSAFRIHGGTVIYISTVTRAGMVIVCTEREWTSVFGEVPWASATAWPGDN
jgi:hypothetical protein